MKVILVILSLLLCFGCAAEELAETPISEPVEATNEVSITTKKIESDLPVVQHYFQAVVHEDLGAFLDVFSEDAVVTVVSRELDTIDEISGFATREVFGGLYEIYRVEVTEEGVRMLLQFTPKGWDAPEPMAVYDFEIEDNKVTTANLQYATDNDKDYFKDLRLNDTDLIPYGFSLYLEGVTKDNAKLLVSGFTNDGSVKDVGRLIDGPESIERWADREVLSLDYDVLKIVYTDRGAVLFNHVKFGSGSNGFYASYDLSLEDGLIQYADLQYSEEAEMIY